MKNYQQRTQNILNKTKKERRKRRWIRAAAITSACAVAITALNLTLFLPYPTPPERLSAYKGSEYYPIIQTVDRLTYRETSKKQPKNNWEKWTAAFANLFAIKGGADLGATPDIGIDFEDSVMDSATEWPEGDLPIAPGDDGNSSQAPSAPDGGSEGTTGDNTSDGKYEEVTDNQVEGVIEGDLFKRTNDYIFHLRGGLIPTGDNLETAYDENAVYSGSGYVLSVYSIAKNQSKRVGRYEITPDQGMQFYTGDAEMYLSADGKTATIITPSFDRENATLYTAAISLNVSSPAAITETNRCYVSGNHVTSRLTDGKLLLVSNFRVKNQPNYDNPEDYLPQVGAAGEMESLPADNILLPEVKTGETARYTVVTTLHPDNLAVQGSYAFFAYSENVYVSKDNLFATRTVTQDERVNGFLLRESVTDVSCVSYAGETLAFKGSTSVKGRVNNQYSMDEYDGKLRVFTTFESTTYEEHDHGDGHVSLLFRGSYTSASLYVVDLSDFSIAASVERFAPQGETVRAARFDKNKAYVCTAVEFTDPVFAFNLSDLANITYTDTGEIKGYSFSLTKFTGGTLLGIGYNGSRSLKIELYEETQTGVVSVACYEPDKYTSVSEEYKAHFIDAEHGYVGFFDIGAQEYVLLQFDGYSLREAFREPFISHAGQTRGCMVDGWMYILGTCGLKPVQVY